MYSVAHCVPQLYYHTFGVLETANLQLVGGQGDTSSGTATGSRIYYIPLHIDAVFQVNALYVVNGAAVSGNIDIGLYTANFNKVVSTGSIAQAGTNGPQLQTVTSTSIPAGLYYYAVVADNGVSTFFRLALTTATGNRGFACALQNATFPLPASGTPATIDGTNFDYVFGGATSETFVI